MDAYARAFKIARRILDEGKLDAFVRQRYGSFDVGIGRDIECGKIGFRELADFALKSPSEIPLISGRQEYLENLLARYVYD